MNAVLLPDSASSARSVGAKMYFTGRPCKRGHIAARTTSSSVCTECAAEWNRANAEHIREYERDRAIRPGRKEAKRATEKAWRENKRATTPWEICVRNSRKRAASAGLVFELDYEWGRTTWTGKCAITGIAFSVNHGIPHVHPMTASIDRIDSSIGYTKENCRFILSCVNTFRSTLSDDQMIKIARAIAGPKGQTGLNEREWDCPDCGAHHLRDVNAAINIRERGHALLAGGIPVL